MLFNSIEYLIFFILSTSLYFILDHKYRWMLLLGVSCFFYMYFKPVYILILAFTIVIDFYVGIALERTENKALKKRILYFSIIANLGILVFFKYWNFFFSNVNELLFYFKSKQGVPLLEFILPIGLSFHTFQAMSYTIEVYRGKQKAEKHFGIYSLYVMFYPQLVAGPIERPQNILHQFKNKIAFSYTNFKTGLLLILLGLIKKVVIADRLGSYVDSYYSNVEVMTFFPSLLAIIFYSFQIYCDFSGYSLIAIGSAKCLGINFIKNFNKPYFSTSFSEFWRRWHISLSTWFRDYLYFPLGGNKKGKLITNRNLFIVFILSGFWHGANWTFLFWGFLHALFLILENTFDIFGRINLNRFIKQLLIFSFVSFAWIFFRSENFQQAFLVVQNISNFKLDFRLNQLSAQISPYNLLLCLFSIILLYAIEKTEIGFLRRNLLLFFIAGTLLLILFGVSNESQFIYFQF
jgi:alginate O-acetyltransferase complex protein AlgI